MTSEERREARYKRRVAKRLAQRNKKIKNADSFRSVFSYANTYRAYQACRKGSSKKKSVQLYISFAPVNVYSDSYRVRTEKYKMVKYYEFDTRERGVLRHIMSMRFRDRVINHCFGKNALVPVITRSFIYDNCASIKKKGYDFALKGMTRDLREHYAKHGNKGYILLFDFKKFFENVDHAVIKADLNRKFNDKRIIRFAEMSIDSFGEKGLGLGNVDSQIWALDSANPLDHYIKEVLRIKHYIRYNDDGYLIHESKEYLVECLEKISVFCSRYGITLHEKKTQIVKLSHGFKWLKVRWYLTETGKVLRKIYKRSLVVMRRKLKKLHKKYLAGEKEFDAIATSVQCWLAYSTKFNAYRTRNRIIKLFNTLFHEEMRYREWSIVKSSVKLVVLLEPRLLTALYSYADRQKMAPSYVAPR